MKTTISVQKTENRNNKTFVMKTLVLLISVAMLSFTASAGENNNNWSANEGDKHINASASLAFLSPASKTLHLTEAAVEVSAEESLEVESWMINETMFTSPVPAEETEESLELESWMLTGENFVDTLNARESEKALEVESWMLDQNRWGN
ncbi:MAG TPA: hypothetical protein VFG54_03480 [Prolixibacteraceae bacterium]|nr:hypothetical protein [Prolixibacteraceae bacterium]